MRAQLLRDSLENAFYFIIFDRSEDVRQALGAPNPAELRLERWESVALSRGWGRLSMVAAAAGVGNRVA